MARHVWSILCTKASIDSRSNNVSLFEVIERLVIGGVPPEGQVVLPITLNLVILWSREHVELPEIGSGRFWLVSPDGNRNLGGTFDINMTGDFIRTRNIVQMNGLLLRGPGFYEFEIEYQGAGSNEWQRVSSFPLEVRYEDVQAGAP